MEREEALVLLMGAHTKALAVIMAATLSTLVKEGVLTEEADLNGLRTTASDARSKLASEDDLHPDRHRVEPNGSLGVVASRSRI